MLAEFEHRLEEVIIIPSSGGAFEVTLDGDLIYSKKATRKHADPEALLADLRSRIS